MPICPAGHQTNATDFCDTCGLPIAPGDAAVAPAPIPAPVGGPVICPHCQTPNVADALFCEACGYDFTTGSLPIPDVGAAPEPLVEPVETTPEPEPLVEPVETTPEPAAEPPPEQPSTTPPPLPEEPSASEASRRAPQSPAEPPARPQVEWVAELWIDPDWYAAQGSSDPLPSPGLPDIVPLVKPSNLIGRVSHSRGIFPDVDCELDSGCSRRHAMLTTDGTRWWIEDLDSANGTFVGAAAGPLPAMPIPQGRVELTAGQRIYVGAWTRIVVRRATEDEQEALAS
nr:FHA domain-containing protein [Propionicimonas sp.]